MVAVNHNSDMGDAWEHADDPRYPAPMTATAYWFGVNYVVTVMPATGTSCATWAASLM